MAYSLIIAEDEQLIRNGLTKFVAWGELGFELSTVFSDGSEVLEYLHQNIPDVLLMDIKMVQVSGLDVAKFIFENKLPIKIILLSGHKSFEFAQQAVEFNIEHYLLKPVSVPKLKQVFQDLRNKLDKESTMEDALQYRMDRYNRLMDYQKHQFVLETLMGTLRAPEEIEKQLDLLGGKGQACLLFEVSLCQNEALRSFLSDYGAQELEEQLVHLFQSYDERLDFYLVDSTHNKLIGLFWEKCVGCLESLQAWERGLTEMLTGLVEVMTGLTVIVSATQFFSSAEQLASYRKPQNPSKVNPDLLNDSNHFHHLREQKKLLLTYMTQGDCTEAEQLVKSFIGQCLTLGVTFAQNQLMHFFPLTVEKISDGETMLFTRLLCELNLLEISALSDEQKLIEWSQEKVYSLMKLISGKQTSNDSIAKLQQYIRDNYAKDITLSDAAEQVYLNPIYISRIFKERTGKTFTEYLAEVRINAAVDLLDHSNRYVYEICELAGYHNLKYFYKIFKKMRGCSPSEYREKKVADSAGMEEK